MKFGLKNVETTSFKKRYPVGYRYLDIKFGDAAFTFCKSYNIEYIYIYNYRRSLKKFYKFKKNTKKKLWLFLHKNYPLTKKSKNSRMGKGKGGLSRYCSRILKNHNIFEFAGFNFYELVFLKKIFKKKINIPIKILSNFFFKKNYTIHSCCDAYFFFFRNYRK